MNSKSSYFCILNIMKDERQPDKRKRGIKTIGKFY